MITVTFYESDNLICGFDVSGHSGYSDEGSDIICSAVSSAVLMAANTITDVQFLKADVTDRDGYVNLKMPPNEAVKAAVTLNGLKLHLIAFSKQYKKYIKVKFSEV